MMITLDEIVQSEYITKQNGKYFKRKYKLFWTGLKLSVWSRPEAQPPVP